MLLRCMLAPLRRQRRDLNAVISCVVNGFKRLDAPPPKEVNNLKLSYSTPGKPFYKCVVVEYSEGEEDFTDYFIDLADKLEDVYPHIIVTGNPEGMNPREGAFEVKFEDVVLFSRLKAGKLPKADELLPSLEKHLGENE